MKFFSVDSAFYRFISRFWDMIQVNFFWLIGCIPIVTIGASTAAAFHVCLKLSDEEESYIWREYVKGFRENWKQGTVTGFLILISSYAVYLDLQFFEAVEGNPVIFLIAGIVSACFFAMCLLYVYPLITRYRNSMAATIKNSWKIATRYLARTILILVLLVVELFIWFFNSTTIFIGFFIGPACLFYTIAGMSLAVFREVEVQNENL